MSGSICDNERAQGLCDGSSSNSSLCARARAKHATAESTLKLGWGIAKSASLARRTFLTSSLTIPSHSMVSSAHTQLTNRQHLRPSSCGFLLRLQGVVWSQLEWHHPKRARAAHRFTVGIVRLANHRPTLRYQHVYS